MTFKIIPIEQRTPEWYEFKKDKISASIASAIMGMNPWMTPLQLYESIQSSKEIPLNDAMKKGIYLEPMALEEFNLCQQLEYKPVVIQSEEFPQLMASLDGFTWVNGIPKAVEIKCPSKQEIFHSMREGNIPEYYLPQLQMIMMLLGSDWMHFGAYFEEELAIVEVGRDDDLIQNMKPKLLEFHERIVNFDPPEATERDYVEWKENRYIAKAWMYAKTIQDLRELEESAQLLRKELTENAPHPLVKVGPITMKKYESKGLVNYKWLVEKEKVDIEKYRKEPLIKWKIDVEEA